MALIKMNTDKQRKELRENILTEAVAAIQARDHTRVEAAIKKATDEWFLDTADWIRGHKAYVEKDFPSALEYFEKALKLDPSFIPAHNSKIAVLIELGSLDEAIKSADYAISHLLLVQFAPYYYNKGVALERLKRFDEAIFCFFRAIEDDADYLMAYGAILNIFGSLEEWPKFFSTSALFKERLKDKPSLLDAMASLLLQLTEKAFKDGKTDSAKTFLEEAGIFLKIAVEKEPENTSILYNLACFYSRSGNEIGALANLKKAFDRSDEKEKKRLKELSRSDVDFANIRQGSTFKDLVFSP